MKLEDQFPTKEQCEKLVKIGVVLDTSQFWVCCGGKWQMGIGKSFLEELGPAIISAPSVAELGVLLPDVIVHNETGVWYNLLIWKSTSISWNAGYFDDEYKILVNRWADQSLANVLADRLTWLIENGYLKVEDLKL